MRCVQYRLLPWPLAILAANFLLPMTVALERFQVSEADAESALPPRRRMAYVGGHWRVTYLHSSEQGREAHVREGLLVGPLVADTSGTTLWVAVVPNGSIQHTMVRRDSIIHIEPPPNMP